MFAGCGFSARSAQQLPHDAGSDAGPIVVDAATDAAPMCTNHLVPPSLAVDPMQWKASFLTAPSWSCTAAGTTTIDTAAGTVTSTSCALGTPDVTSNVAQQAGGSTVMVVRLRGLDIRGGHHLL